MGKIACLFTGQGSQYPGMGKELYENYDVARQVYDQANSILNRDITGLCFEGTDEELSKTENTQPAILVTSLAIMKVLEEKNIKADFTAGLSLGEYSALICGGVLSFYDGLRLVEKRGRIMEEAVPAGKGAMAAILGLDRESVELCCMEMKHEGIVEVANYNCPGQLVITGEKETVEKTALKLKDAGAMKVVMLNVSGPFHSSLLKEAGEKLGEEIKKVQVSNGE